MFQEEHSLEHRCVESARIRGKYPDRVPVIVEKASGSQVVDTDKRKYLVPSDITVAQLTWAIRKRIQLPSEKAIFPFVDKTVPQSSLTAGQRYEKQRAEDGPLDAAPGGEDTLGFRGPRPAAPPAPAPGTGPAAFSSRQSRPRQTPVSASVTGFSSLVCYWKVSSP
ncbi:gamma-aminobutyric acid receptor-associated protein-like 2 [Sorex araneus]|uniref:gamma-aminobutyric acid receptor-associated protein-like 2 n=1 Tax=Sorex araneus TaxID=42254 RepID=UPI002433BDA7|nr:gamma-aminobutyric acid receptor-associated protein-like 2 [Sorex araneus]